MKELKFTPNMRKGIDAMMAYPFATYEEIGNIVGCSGAAVKSWKRHPLFQEELDKRLREEWSGARRMAQKQMMILAENGDYRAIQYILDSNGYQAPQKIELNNNVIKVTVDEDE